MLTIVDDFSKFTWTYMIKSKNIVSQTFIDFYAMIRTHFESSIKTVRTDNGGEFLSYECQKFFKKTGIFHQKTCPYTPQQNGVVERKHQHLLQVARSLLFQAKLPIMFWPFSILMATHIINRIPSQILN